MAFAEIGIDIEWHGSGLEEVGRHSETGEILVRVDEKLYRPSEVNLLIGDSTKAFNELGWKAKTSLEDLCQMMVDSDIQKVTTGVSF